MSSKPHDITAQAVVDFSRNGLKILADKYGGACTLNEARVMIQIIWCHIEGLTCSVTALHKATGIPIPTVSRSVAHLQSEGWLSGRRDPNDGRKRIISLGHRSWGRTAYDLNRQVEWIKEFREHGLPG